MRMNKSSVIDAIAATSGKLISLQAEITKFKTLKAVLDSSRSSVSYVLDGTDFSSTYNLEGEPYDQATKLEMDSVKNLNRDLMTIQSEVSSKLQSKISQLEAEASTCQMSLTLLQLTLSSMKE